MKLWKNTSNTQFHSYILSIVFLTFLASRHPASPLLSNFSIWWHPLMKTYIYCSVKCTSDGTRNSFTRHPSVLPHPGSESLTSRVKCYHTIMKWTTKPDKRQKSRISPNVHKWRHRWGIERRGKGTFYASHLEPPFPTVLSNLKCRRQIVLKKCVKTFVFPTWDVCWH